MKKLIPLLIAVFLVGLAPTQAQLLKKLGKRAERAAERTIERRVDKETTEKTDEVLDSILEPGSKRKNGKNPTSRKSDPNKGSSQSGGNASSIPNKDPGTIAVYSKFDFVPGDKVVFFDDFSSDYVGDFPSKWNTNGSGEIVTIGEDSKKWLELKPGYGIVYIPDVPQLPEEYTIEFDVLATGLDKKTSSTAVLKVGVSDDPTFKWGNYANIDMPFCQYAPVGFFARNGGTINNKIDGDIRDEVLAQPHISIAVNKQRFRLWVNESKYVDIPRMIPSDTSPSTIKFELREFKDSKERLFITNVKVAEGGQDLRGKLITEGRVSTNAILFESGSAKLKPQSMGVIRQIAQVLQQENGMTLKIVGHTDADGDNASNLTLSEKRAATVKNTLVSVYGIDSNRLQTEGKGETEPVADNGTTDGKAQNRRVEFIKV